MQKNKYRYQKVKAIVKVLLVLITYHLSLITSTAQDVIVNPDISSAGTPRTCEIAGLTTKGVEGYEDYVLIGLSGLSVGQTVAVPGPEITEAVKRYWKHGLFSKAAITADSIVGSKIYLCIHLATRPRVSAINYYGLKKSEREDMDAKLGIMRGSQITPNMIDRAKILDEIKDLEIKEDKVTPELEKQLREKAFKVLKESSVMLSVLAEQDKMPVKI